MTNKVIFLLIGISMLAFWSIVIGVWGVVLGYVIAWLWGKIVG
jgi:hypothetical protein